VCNSCSNLGGINWGNGSIRPKASNTKQCKQLLDINHDHALEQMVSKHTYITESSHSTLDLFFYKQQHTHKQGRGDPRYKVFLIMR
jgi:hypothetical protein